MNQAQRPARSAGSARGSSRTRPGSAARRGPARSGRRPCRWLPVVAEVAERRADVRQVVGKGRRQDDPALDVLEVGGEAPQPLDLARSLDLAAEILRTDVGDRLLDVQPVGAAEQREDAVRLVGGDRQGRPGGLLPVMIAGTARPVKSATVVLLRYQVACRARAAKWGKRRASILAAAVEQRRGRELVEDHHHHRRPRGDLTPSALASLWGRISFEVSLKKRKMTRKTTGATARTSSRLRTKRVRISQ